MKTTPIKKIGLIQNYPLPGDFSNNIRTIVQGYRECLDQGAELVIAPAYALCGMEPKDLAQRNSFQRQQQMALKTLAQETSAVDVPLILGAYPSDEGDDWLADALDDSLANLTSHSPEPCILENGDISFPEPGEIITIGSTTCQLAIEPEEITENVRLAILLPMQCWYLDQPTPLEQDLNWLADDYNCTLVHVNPTGFINGNLYGGGSCVVNKKGTIARLPYFEATNQVINLKTTRQAEEIEEPVVLLRKAIIRGIRDSVRAHGYTGVCIPLDHANATLLAALCVEAVGATHVLGITFKGDTSLENTLGISCRFINIDNAESLTGLVQKESASTLTERIKGSLLATLAEERGYMLLSPLSRHDAELGNYTLYGESNGFLAPLGNLYRIDLHMLKIELKASNPQLFGTLEEPNHPENDHILHALTELNISAGDILKEQYIKASENEIRHIQRRVIASSLKRLQFPTTILLNNPSQRLTLPPVHRLND